MSTDDELSGVIFKLIQMQARVAEIAVQETIIKRELSAAMAHACELRRAAVERIETNENAVNPLPGSAACSLAGMSTGI